MMESEDIHHKHHNSSPLSALMLLALGTILLLNNFGLISWNIWEVLWKFWPVILIFWGLKEIFGNSVISNLLLGIIGLAIILFNIAYSLALTNQGFKYWLETNYPIWTRVLNLKPKDSPRIDTI